MIAAGEIVRRVDRRRFAPTRIGALSSWTLFDPNSLVQDADDGNPDGVSVQLQGAAASRDLPDTGATWSRAGVVDALGRSISSFSPQLFNATLRVYEREVPATEPNLGRLWFGWMNAADPNTATEGIGWGIDYPSTNLRRVVAYRCVSGTWAATPGSAGQATCFGVNGSYVPRSPSAVHRQGALPLDSTGGLGTIGTNTVDSNVVIAASGWTHTFFGIGWQTSGGNNGDVWRFAGAYWLFPIEGGA